MRAETALILYFVPGKNTLDPALSTYNGVPRRDGISVYTEEVVGSSLFDFRIKIHAPGLWPAADVSEITPVVVSASFDLISISSACLRSTCRVPFLPFPLSPCKQ